MARTFHYPSSYKKEDQSAEFRRVLTKLNTQIPEDWTLYVKPSLNGLVLSAVFLHERKGLFVVQVVGKSALVPEIVNLVDVVEMEIAELYCPSSGLKFGKERDRVLMAIICVDGSEEEAYAKVQRSKGSWIQDGNNRSRKCWILGKEFLDALDIFFYIPKSYFDQHAGTINLSDLKYWLQEPDWQRDQSKPTQLNRKQKEYINSRTESGYRRIKGPAGSGKSLILAARAGLLSGTESNRVMMVTFNITLLQYLRSIASRYSSQLNFDSKSFDNLTFFHFHAWCKSIIIYYKGDRYYRSLWRSNVFDALKFRLRDFSLGNPNIATSQIDRERNRVEKELVGDMLNDILPSEVDKVLSNTLTYQRAEFPRAQFDAVFVDEGQDYRINWWSTLRKTVKDTGEMVLAADQTQDIYGTAGLWTESAMKGCGFTGDWVKLEASYRLPAAMLEKSREFLNLYLSGKVDVDLPVHDVEEELNLYPAHLKWIQLKGIDTSTPSLSDIVAKELSRLLDSANNGDPSILDLVLLTEDNFMGKDLIARLKKRGLNVRHTFNKSDPDARFRFGFNSNEILATTIHSFKGWESRFILLIINQASSLSQLASIYTAMTRLKRHEKGSYLTVICGAKELEEYGKGWDEYSVQ